MGDGKQTIWILIVILFLIAIVGIPLSEQYGQINLGDKTIDLSKLSNGVAKYVFGFNASSTDNGLTPYAAIVTYLMIWLIIFITFGDIFETFSTFSPTIAWMIALCLSTITAMSGGIRVGVESMTKWFVWAGTAAVYIALGIAIVFFLAVQIGFEPLLARIKMAQMMKEAVKGEITMDQASKAIKNLKKFEESLEKD
jgi:hypothetical protein